MRIDWLSLGMWVMCYSVPLYFLTLGSMLLGGVTRGKRALMLIHGKRRFSKRYREPLDPKALRQTGWIVSGIGVFGVVEITLSFVRHLGR